ncbi:MAG: DMT family transporter [Paracoccaceae bacterium]
MSHSSVEAAPGPARDNLRGALWLFADMALNIWALAIVKATGADIPAVQIVFVRALVGLILLAPFVWQARKTLRVTRLSLHLARVGLSALTLTTSFFAVAHVPLALFTTMNFLRPLLLMGMAAVLLHERIGARRWNAGGIGILGVIVALRPTEIVFDPGLAALLATVITGTAAIIVTRRLREEPQLVMMLFYTGGLVALTAIPAVVNWQPVQGVWPQLLLVGVFAQAAQACFLRAHYHGEAGVLGPLGYASLILSTAVGYLIFDETPTLALIAGAILIVLAAILATARKPAATFTIKKPPESENSGG